MVISTFKLIHASLLDRPVAGRGYYQLLSNGQPVPCSIKAGRLIAKSIGAELEIIRPDRASALTQQERDERAGRSGQRVSRGQIERAIEMIDRVCSLENN